MRRHSQPSRHSPNVFVSRSITTHLLSRLVISETEAKASTAIARIAVHAVGCSNPTGCLWTKLEHESQAPGLGFWKEGEMWLACVLTLACLLPLQECVDSRECQGGGCLGERGQHGSRSLAGTLAPCPNPRFGLPGKEARCRSLRHLDPRETLPCDRCMTVGIGNAGTGTPENCMRGRCGY